MHTAKPLVGNDPQAFFAGAAYPAPEQLAGKAADSAYYDYTAPDAKADYDSGMMGGSLSLPHLPGQRQLPAAVHGVQHTGGSHGLTHGLFSHGVLEAAGTVIADGTDEHGVHAETGDAGRLHLGGTAEHADKKTGAMADDSKADDHAPLIAEESGKAGSIAAIVDHGAATGSFGAAAERHWEPMAEFVPVEDHPQQIAASEEVSKVFASREIPFGAVMPEPGVTESALPDVVRPDMLPRNAVDNGDSTFGGKAAPGSLVALYDNGTLIDTVLADADGNWSAAPRLGEGAHDILATATDAQGHVEQVSSMRLVIAEQAEQGPAMVAGSGLPMDSDILSAIANAVTPADAQQATASHAALSESAGFSLPESVPLLNGDAADPAVLQLDSAEQVLDLGLLLQLEHVVPGAEAIDGISGIGGISANMFTLGLNDVLEPGGDRLFGNGGGDAVPDLADGDYLLELGAMLSGDGDWNSVATAAGVSYDGGQQASQHLEQLLPGWENQLP